MEFTDRQHLKLRAPQPDRVWSDSVARVLRVTSRWLGIPQFYQIVVPLLFVLFAAPIGLVIFLFYIPKFIRNRGRRQKYAVRLSQEKRERLGGSDVIAER